MTNFSDKLLEELSLMPGDEFRIMKLLSSHGEVSIENICYRDINREEKVQEDVTIILH